MTHHRLTLNFVADILICIKIPVISTNLLKLHVFFIYKRWQKFYQIKYASTLVYPKPFIDK